MHLIIDGYGDNVSLLEDEKALYDILDSYPAVIGMRKVCPPCVFRYVGQNPDDWGISGFVILAESHIYINTFTAHQYVNIDVFSCREFNAEQVVCDFKRFFQLYKIRFRILKRPETWLLTSPGLKKQKEFIIRR